MSTSLLYHAFGIAGYYYRQRLGQALKLNEPLATAYYMKEELLFKLKLCRCMKLITFLYGRFPVWQAIFRVLAKRKTAAVLYPALLQTGFLSAGPDGIRQERPHLLVVLEALVNIQVYGGCPWFCVNDG